MGYTWLYGIAWAANTGRPNVRREVGLHHHVILLGLNTVVRLRLAPHFPVSAITSL